MAAAPDPLTFVPPEVKVVEVGPRDGLRNGPGTVPMGIGFDAAIAAGRGLRPQLGRPPPSRVSRAKQPDG